MYFFFEDMKDASVVHITTGLLAANVVIFLFVRVVAHCDNDFPSVFEQELSIRCTRPVKP